MGRAWKACASCGEPVPPGTTRCADCRSEYEARRGTPTQRGYDAAHRRARRDWARKIRAGGITCWRCDQPIPRDAQPSEWHLGHDDHDRSITRGPEHASCNLAAAGHTAARHRRPVDE